MTWTRLDDGWTDRPIFEQLPYDVRWHYLSLVQFCSRTSRYDGEVRAADARRCSDVPDPVAALQALIDVGLVVAAEGCYRLPFIDEHIPPPSVREASEKAKVRMQRMRKHKNGDHSECLPEHCQNAEPPEPKPPVTQDVTRNTGTGQDGTGLETQPPTKVPEVSHDDDIEAHDLNHPDDAVWFKAS